MLRHECLVLVAFRHEAAVRLNAALGATLQGNAVPVVGRHAAAAVHVVASGIDMGRYDGAGTHGFLTVVARRPEVGQTALDTVAGSFAGLVVVVDHVDLLVLIIVVGRLTAIGGVASPVIYHVVHHVNGTLQCAHIVMVKARIARVVVGYQVVVVEGVLSAPDATVAVGPLVVHRVAQTL